MRMGLLNDIFSNSANDIPAVCDVDLQRYLGTWYEIARLPHSFEEGMEYVTASYAMRPDGKLEVTNAGRKGDKERVAKAVAWVPDRQCPGKLLVSFFRPLRGQYNIIRLDEEDYSYAVVTGSKKSYLWILSRQPQISDQLYDELLQFIAAAGFDTGRLIRVRQAY
ncbi:MAG: lipocalin family protein [Syntrophomonas sp.]|nr:lipocalin family protein [Syntrophomonas sp.]